MENELSNEEKYPSVKYAYDIALKSYDWAIQRSDAVDNGIDKLLAWIPSLNIGIIAIIFSTSKNNIIASFHSNLFLFAMVLLACIIILGFSTKMKGSLTLVTPAILFNQFLNLSEWEFKKDTVYNEIGRA